MKKFFSIFLFLLLSSGVFAGTVTYESALKLASKFFAGVDTTRLSLAWSGYSETPSFYAFNNADGGFVIISGEDVVEPVLAYSREGSFKSEGMPSNLQAVFAGLDAHIVKVKKLHTAQSAEMKRKWASVGLRTKAGTEVFLNTAKWGQDSPYNDACPKYHSKRCVTGCVATAMAILIRYNRHPAKGTGSVGGYYTDSKHFYVEEYSIDSHTYDYDSMPLEYSGSSTSAQKSAVAQLMADCGASVEMDYTPTGSGALTSDQAKAMYTNFGYSKALKLVKRDGYTAKEWLAMIRTEVDAGRPMLAAADDASGDGGHAFVFDGYDDEDRVHVNWGWDGEDNGFYSLNLSVSGYEFSVAQEMTINLIPDDGTATVTPALFGWNTYTYYSPQSIEKGTPIALSVIYYNEGAETFNGYLNFRLVDKNGKVKQETLSDDYSVKVEPNLNYAAGAAFYATITTDLAFGDRIVPIYRTTGSGWELLRFDFYWYDGVSSIPYVDYNFIDIPSVISAGDRIELKLARSSAMKSDVSLKWYYDGVLTTDATVKVTSGEHSIKAVLGTGETIVQKIKVQ